MKRGDNGFSVAPNVTKTEVIWSPRFASVCIPSDRDFSSLLIMQPR
jgi:hypothetical protein